MRNLIIIAAIFVACLYSATAQYSDSTKVDSLISKGVELHNTGDYRSALELYEEALQLSPGSSLIHYEMSLSYFSLGFYEKALEHINRVKETDGKYEKEAILLKSSILDALYKYDEAERILKDAVAKYGDNCLFYYNLAHINYKQEKDDKAAGFLIEAIRANHSHANSHFLLGRIMSKYARKSQAIMSFYYFLLLEPDSPKSKISLKLIDNLIALGVTKNNSDDSSKAKVYISPDTTNLFAEADIYLSLMAAGDYAPHFDESLNDDLFIAQTVAFFTLLENTMQKNADSKSFAINFYTKFFTDLHKAGYTGTFCRYIRQSVSQRSIDDLKQHNAELVKFEEWLNSYYNKQ